MSELGIGAFLASIFCLLMSKDKQSIFGGCLSACASIIMIIFGLVKENPEPLDVYRGKTELQVTETKIDTVVVKRDSVVVWKNNNMRDLVEHKNKESNSGYSHDGIYEIMGFCRMKDPTTREWIDGIIYRNIETFEVFVRERNDFEDKFKAK